MSYSSVASQKGFSILVALGSIGVLLIIMVSLASVYFNELKLSRMQYNNILAYAQAEWAFEYAMLKEKNHRDGFQDTLNGTDPDARIFSGSTERTAGTTVKYTIDSQSHDFTFTISPSSQLILPLSVGTGVGIQWSVSSLNPIINTGTIQVQSIDATVPTHPEDISWNIISMSGSESVGLSGSGEIHPTTIWVIRRKTEECYNAAWAKWTCGTATFGLENGGDTLEYFYDTPSTVSAYLGNLAFKNPYLLIFNSGASDTSMHITTDSPFSLPTVRITTEARKADSMQSIEFSEDKSKYYDAVQYGVYNK